MASEFCLPTFGYQARLKHCATMLPEEPNSRVKTFFSRNGMVILGFIFILSLIALIVVGTIQNKSASENFKYGIVFDAGSSHTTMYIYKWSAEKMNDTGLVYEIEACKVKGPGISAYALRLHDIPVYLTQCMGKAKDIIPKYKHQETPVYLGATAGMRLLRMENQELSDMILSSVTSVFDSYPFNFQGANIIEGSEEGAYGWITINYLMGKIKEKNIYKFIPWRKTESPATYGALDLGGASTQIAYVPETTNSVSSDKLMHFRLYGKNYTVFTTSYLCYGKDQALLRKLAKDAQELTIQGTGDFLQCRDSILDLFSVNYCTDSDCTFDGVIRPPFSVKFEAFSAYYYSMNFLNLTSDKVSSWDMTTEKMKEYCAMPWDKVSNAFARVKESYRSEYCFAGTYILLLLKKYNFTEYWNQIDFIDKIDDNAEAGWTLGYMLNLTNMIPAELPKPKPFTRPTYITLMVCFSLVLAIVFILGTIIFHKSLNFWQ
ncbi:PREDICTED: ectonucleoside triphosphate diphosphohydrolase 1 [Elephantulus edwardii]|uniref:ectonucleoside triphosphate diphosphohydrolase 1 n=1 Tax=Elephantulus edwardii TaxID=28737 RepID=UPI0003F0A85B|nr:PREDICTED: ectonucleoside triphosphate diphosphohydrolase 1 [Elephantulus edwardii]